MRSKHSKNAACSDLEDNRHPMRQRLRSKSIPTMIVLLISWFMCVMALMAFLQCVHTPSASTDDNKGVFVHTMLATGPPHDVNDIAWVTQLTADRLDIFSKMLPRWDGPVSATLYVRDLPHDLAAIAPLRTHVDFHLVLADLHQDRLYPVNTLRNVAIDNCRADWVLLVDADFVPNQGLHAQLSALLPAWNAALPTPRPAAATAAAAAPAALGGAKFPAIAPGTGRSVYVVPAFQLMHGETHVPVDKAELLSMGDRVSPVHPEPGRDIAHKPTDYPRWRTADAPYAAEYKMPYEPYFAAPRSGLPRYDPAFLGYGNDKMQHAYELYMADYTFTVLPTAFVFHVEHPRGQWQDTDRNWIDRAPPALSAFIADVEARYPPAAAGDGSGAPRRTVTPTASVQGENCSAACERARPARAAPPDPAGGGSGSAAAAAAAIAAAVAGDDAAGDDDWGCQEELFESVNTCEAARAAFPGRCGGTSGCSTITYGPDLPAYNVEQRRCLLNTSPRDFPTVCGASHPKSERVCPCGKRMGRWLTKEYVVEVLSRAGGWTASDSITGKKTEE